MKPTNGVCSTVIAHLSDSSQVSPSGVWMFHDLTAQGTAQHSIHVNSNVITPRIAAALPHTPPNGRILLPYQQTAMQCLVAKTNYAFKIRKC
jgi:hypothetical protein